MRWSQKGWARFLDDQEYEEYTADTGDGLVRDAALQERLRPLGVLTPDGRFICRGEGPKKTEPRINKRPIPRFP